MVTAAGETRGDLGNGIDSGHKRVLVTGAAGFIGARVTEFLLEEGREVIGIDDMNDAYDVRLKEYRLSRLQGRPGFVFALVDITDRERLAAVWGEHGPFAGVVNLAARAGVRYSVENPWVYVDTNINGTLNLLDLCRRDGPAKVVLASTSSLYGGHNPLPYAEDVDTSRPLSPYAASKQGAEALCFAYHHLHGLDVTVFRYFTVYGPAGRPDMSPFRFCQWISEELPVRVFGDGTQSRDFTFVDDIARGTILGLRPLGFEVINLGCDQPSELRRLIALIEKETGKRAELAYSAAHAADVPATWASIEKAKRLLGWEPQIGLEEGVRRLVSWYREQREWARHVRVD